MIPHGNCRDSTESGGIVGKVQTAFVGDYDVMRELILRQHSLDFVTVCDRPGDDFVERGVLADDVGDGLQGIIKQRRIVENRRHHLLFPFPESNTII